MLFATAYMLSDFYARNELLAVFASGISLFKFSVPLLTVAVAMSFALFIFEDNIVVPSFSNPLKYIIHNTNSKNSTYSVFISSSSFFTASKITLKSGFSP